MNRRLGAAERRSMVLSAFLGVAILPDAP